MSFIADEEVTVYSYRPRLGGMAASVVFFAVCGVVLTLKAQESAALYDWALVVASWVFVLGGSGVTLVGFLYPQRIVLTRDGLIVPDGRWSKSAHEVPLASIEHVALNSVHGQEWLRIFHRDGEVSILASMLPSDDAFEAIFDHVWPSASGEDLQSVRASRSLPVSRWQFGLMVLCTLVATWGGPLYVSELLERSLDSTAAFAIGFVPTALVLFGMFSLLEDELSGFAGLVVWAGGLGAVAMVAESVYAVWQVTGGEVREDTALIMSGAAASVLLSAAYYWLWRCVRRS